MKVAYRNLKVLQAKTVQTIQQTNQQTSKQAKQLKYDFKVNGIDFCGIAIVRHETKYIKPRYFFSQRVLNSCGKLIFSSYFDLIWVLLVN